MYKFQSLKDCYQICDYANENKLKIVHIDKIISTYDVNYHVIFEE